MSDKDVDVISSATQNEGEGIAIAIDSKMLINNEATPSNKATTSDEATPNDEATPSNEATPSDKATPSNEAMSSDEATPSDEMREAQSADYGYDAQRRCRSNCDEVDERSESQHCADQKISSNTGTVGGIGSLGNVDIIGVATLSRPRVFIRRVIARKKCLHHPVVFLILSIGSAILFINIPLLGVLTALITVLFCFRLKWALLFIFIYLSSQYLYSHSTFVLDFNTTTKEMVVISSKGRLKGVELANGKNVSDLRRGDLLWGSFEFVKHRYTLPRRWANSAGEYTVHRIPIISWLLEKRVQQSKYLLYASGGEINTTPTHLFAYRVNIPNNVNDDYIVTGLAHLLAMSGTHVAIFLAGFYLFTPFLPYRIRLIPAVILLPFLIILSGFTITVIRAVLFAMAFAISYSADLKVRSTYFLAAIAGAIIIFSPYSICSVSFLLSFFAVFGIIVIFNSQYKLFINIIIMGVASTIFTLPIQLYFFGTSNVMSVLTTALFIPVVWCQMLFGMLSVVLPNLMLAPLIYIERFGAWYIGVLSDMSWQFMYISKPNAIVLGVTFVLALLLCATKYRALSLLLILLPLLPPLYPTDRIIFPKLAPSAKGYIVVTDEGSEIFYQGMRSGFVYSMVPAAAQLGIKRFDYGKIRIFDAENRYLKINNPNESLGVVCVNEESGCRFQYMTRSHTVSPPIDEDTIYVLYNNKYIADNIIIHAEVEGNIIFEASTRQRLK